MQQKFDCQQSSPEDTKNEAQFGLQECFLLFNLNKNENDEFTQNTSPPKSLEAKEQSLTQSNEPKHEVSKSTEKIIQNKLQEEEETKQEVFQITTKKTYKVKKSQKHVSSSKKILKKD